jgi:hypothetical protein
MVNEAPFSAPSSPFSIKMTSSLATSTSPLAYALLTLPTLNDDNNDKVVKDPTSATCATTSATPYATTFIAPYAYARAYKTTTLTINESTSLSLSLKSPILTYNSPLKLRDLTLIR